MSAPVVVPENIVERIRALCHERLEAGFPDYELLYIKQKYGVLEYQAFPRQLPGSSASGGSTN